MTMCGVSSRGRIEEPIAVSVARELVEKMEAGEFAAGQKLPSEASLAKAFGISRPSVREALSALQFAGYVESRQGFGSVVRAANLRNPVAAAVGPTSDPVEVIQARLALEPEAVRLAAAGPSAKQIRVARQMLDGMWLAVAAAGELPIDSDIGLHLAIVDICPNRYLRDVTTMLLRITNPPQWRGARISNWSDARLIETWAVEHEAVLSAITRRQPELAARCARRHLYSTIERIATKSEIPEADKVRLQAILKMEFESPWRVPETAPTARPRLIAARDGNLGAARPRRPVSAPKDRRRPKR